MNNHTSPTTEAVISVDRGNTDGDMTGVGVRCICGKLYTFTHDPAIRVEVTGVQCLCGYFATTHGSLRSAPEPAAPTTNSVSSSSKSASPGEPCGKRWYLASKNDGLFIIDTRPNTDNDSPHHETTRGPDMALNVTDLPQAKAQAIVDAHNARLSGEPSAEQAPIARINVENNGLIEVATVMHLYAPGLPPGEHDLYCEAGADPVRLAADELVAHIGAVGEIDSRHRLVLNCLEALNSTGLPRAPEPAGKYANMRRDELEDSIDELAASVERGRSIIEALRSFIEPSDPEISVVELDWAQEADDYLAGKSPPTKRDGE